MTVHGIGAMAGPDAEQAIEELYRTHGLGLVRFALLQQRAAWHDPPVWSAEAAVIDGEDRRAVLAAVASLTRQLKEQQ